MSDDGEHLYTASRDASVKQWSLQSAAPQMETSFHGHTDWVNDIKLFDDRLLLSCSSDKTIKVRPFRSSLTSRRAHPHHRNRHLRHSRLRDLRLRTVSADLRRAAAPRGHRRRRAGAHTDHRYGLREGIIKARAYKRSTSTRTTCGRWRRRRRCTALRLWGWAGRCCCGTCSLPKSRPTTRTTNRPTIWANRR